MYAFTQIDYSDKANAHNVPFRQEDSNTWSHLRQLSSPGLRKWVHDQDSVVRAEIQILALQD